MVNGRDPLVPPPGPGFVSDTLTGPTVVNADAGKLAYQVVPLCNTAKLRLPRLSFVNPATNPLPISPRLNAGEPAVIEDFDSPVNVGKGLLITLNGIAALIPPLGPGLTNVTWTVPAVASAVAGICAYHNVPIGCTGKMSEPKCKVVKPDTNPEPVRMRLSAGDPLGVHDFDNAVNVGTGLSTTLKVNCALVPPPGPGLVSITGTTADVATADAGTSTYHCVPEGFTGKTREPK